VNRALRGEEGGSSPLGEVRNRGGQHGESGQLLLGKGSDHAGAGITREENRKRLKGDPLKEKGETRWYGTGCRLENGNPGGLDDCAKRNSVKV